MQAMYKLLNNPFHFSTTDRWDQFRLFHSSCPDRDLQLLDCSIKIDFFFILIEILCLKIIYYSCIYESTIILKCSEGFFSFLIDGCVLKHFYDRSNISFRKFRKNMRLLKTNFKKQKQLSVKSSSVEMEEYWNRQLSYLFCRYFKI